MRPVEIRLKATRPVPDSRRMYVAKCDGGTRAWLDGQSKMGDYFVASFQEFGAFCLACDQENPVIGPVHYKPGSNLSFTASDGNGSGIDEDRSSVFINHEWVPLEWNPKTRKFSLHKKYLTTGGGQIEIRILDKSGNESTRTLNYN